MSNILDELQWRGLLQDASDPDGISKLGSGDAFYVGFDPTASSLQVGNLVPLITSMHLSKAGLQPIILFGGATGSIGDPSGKSAERNLLDLTTIRDNLALQTSQTLKLWENSAISTKPEFVNNFDWTHGLDLLTFLRDVGKHFTVNYMVAKDVVKNRLQGEGISYTEFSYMLLQAFDFLHLYHNKNCKLQIGGSDQWGNITAGLELIRKKIQGNAFAFSIPLLTDSEGKKFGKSAGNAIWLDPAQTSPYRFYQFWLNVPDADVERLLKVFTFFDREKIAGLVEVTRTAPEKREGQQQLARSVTTLVHGEAAADQAISASQALFGGSLSELSVTDLLDIFSEAPSTTFSRDELAGMNLLTVLSKTAVSSKGEAKRLIQGGGVYVNNDRISDENLVLADSPLLSRGIAVIRTGKKNYHLLRVT